MQGEVAVQQSLNQCLGDQLTAINQLFLHARMAGNWGLGEFNEYEYKRSIQAMKDADKLIERLLFLEALPNLQDLGKLLIGEDIPEMLDGDLRLLSGVRGNLQAGVRICEEHSDYVSRDLLEGLLGEVEEHIDWIETQQWLIANTGLENYLQSQMED